MRMDQTAALSAKQVVNEWPFEDLVRIFYKYGKKIQQANRTQN